MCADQQKKGWQAHDWIFERQSQFHDVTAVNTQLTLMTDALKLEKATFTQCLDAEATKEVLRAQSANGKKAGVNGTPTVVVNKKKLPNGQMLPVLQGLHQLLKTGQK